MNFVTLPALSKIPFIVHGFTLRKLDNGQNFDLNLYNCNRSNHVEKNLKKLTKLIGFPSTPVISCRQVHHNKIINVDLQKNTPQKIQKMPGDGLLTNQPNVILAVLTADCLPILLIDKKQKAIAAIHAGRKGTMLSIVEKAIDQMGILFGTMPEDLIVGIGPGIRKCCYEVDILEHNLRQIMYKGVLKENIFSLDQCTSCKKDIFFSYRAEKGKTGRMFGFIMIKNS
tara:strand:- start:29612 stop:30292 length:681 start_codon:yes stop_codon:yes gene_type:complete